MAETFVNGKQNKVTRWPLSDDSLLIYEVNQIHFYNYHGNKLKLEIPMILFVLRTLYITSLIVYNT